VSDNWNSYLTRIDGQVASIAFDLGIASKPPKAEFPMRALLRIELVNPRSDGLPSPDEFAALDAIDDDLTPAATTGGNAISVGRMTSAGARRYFFYVRDTSIFDRAVNTAMRAHRAYRYEIRHKHEPNWEAYFDLLYPNPIEMQMMGNRDVCENLRKHGDTLQKARRIEHLVLFNDEASMNRFSMKVTSDGFEIVERGRNDDFDPPYTLIFGRDDVPAAIDDVAIPLFEMAQQFDGRYDGWETLVIRDGEPASG